MVAAGLLACQGQGEDPRAPPSGPEKVRVIVETSANENPGDAASLVRFLHYQEAFEVEAVLATGVRPDPGAPGFIERAIDAYGEIRSALLRIHPGLPEAASLRARLAPTGDADAAERAILDALDRADPRPLWYLRWLPSQEPAGPSPLLRALDRLRAGFSPEVYRAQVRRLRVIGEGLALGPHGSEIALWIDAQGAFDAKTDRHLTADPAFAPRIEPKDGPLAALYPAGALELASRTFFYLLPNGLGVPHLPAYGGWGGRYVPDPGGGSNRWQALPADVAGTRDTWSLLPWADDIRNDFQARVEAAAGRESNRPPVVAVTATTAKNREMGRDAASTAGEAAYDPHLPLSIGVLPGESVVLDASASHDPDKDALSFGWTVDLSSSSYAGAAEIAVSQAGPVIELAIPDRLPENQTLVLVLAVHDHGSPPLVRYRRMVIVRRQ